MGFPQEDGFYTCTASSHKPLQSLQARLGSRQHLFSLAEGDAHPTVTDQAIAGRNPQGSSKIPADQLDSLVAPIVLHADNLVGQTRLTRLQPNGSSR